MNFNHALIDLGLTEKEATAYLTLLPLRQASAYDISRLSGMKRSTVYVILESLRERNLVLKSPHTARQLYSARDPQHFLNERMETMRENIELAGTLAPKLHALMPQEHNANVLQFDGWKGVVQAMEYFTEQLRVGEEVVSFYTYTETREQWNAMPKTFHKAMDSFYKTFALKKCHVRGLHPDMGETAEENKQIHASYGFDVRFLSPDVYSSKVSATISDTLVMTVSRDMGQSIITENRDIADMHKQIFEMCWEATNTKK